MGMTHLIASIHFPKGVKADEYDACPMTCVCGWAGTVAEWEQHRGLRANTERKHIRTGKTRWELKP